MQDHVQRVPGSFRIQSISHHFLASLEGRSLVELSPQLIKEGLCTWRMMFRKVFKIPALSSSSAMANLLPTWLLHWVAQIDPSFFHSHCHFLSQDPVSFFHSLSPCLSATFFILLGGLSKIPLQSCHLGVQILQPSHCLQNRVQALHRVPEASQGLMPSCHLNFIPTSVSHEPAASVNRSIQSLLGLIPVFLQTPNTYSCPLLCRHPSQLSRPISNTTGYMKPFCSPSS